MRDDRHQKVEFSTDLLSLECMHRYEKVSSVANSDACTLGDLKRTQALLHNFLVLLLARLWEEVLDK
jgi:hypothetical protein